MRINTSLILTFVLAVSFLSCNPAKKLLRKQATINAKLEALGLRQDSTFADTAAVIVPGSQLNSTFMLGSTRGDGSAWSNEAPGPPASIFLADSNNRATVQLKYIEIPQDNRIELDKLANELNLATEHIEDLEAVILSSVHCLPDTVMVPTTVTVTEYKPTPNQGTERILAVRDLVQTISLWILAFIVIGLLFYLLNKFNFL